MQWRSFWTSVLLIGCFSSSLAPAEATFNLRRYQVFDNLNPGGLQPGFQIQNIVQGITERQGVIPDVMDALMDGINAMRMEMCSVMHTQHTEDFAQFNGCKKFMRKQCRPGEDRSMDGDEGERPTGRGWCKGYFPFDEKAEAPQEIAEEKIVHSPAKPQVEAKKLVKPQSVKPQEGVNSSTPEEGHASASHAPSSPSPSAAPAAAPYGADSEEETGGRSTPEITSAPEANTTKKVATKGAAHSEADRPLGHMEEIADMNGSKGLPEQGYHGDMVEHNNGETATSDWQGEGQHGDMEAICKTHPENVWCRRNGYHTTTTAKEERSQATALTPLLACALPMASLAFSF